MFLKAKPKTTPERQSKVLSIAETKALPAETLEALKLGQQVEGAKFSLTMDRHGRVIASLKSITRQTSRKLESPPAK